MSDNHNLGKRDETLAGVAGAHRVLSQQCVNLMIACATDKSVLENGGHVSRRGYDLTPASARHRLQIAEQLHVAAVTLGGAIQLAHPHQAAFLDLHIRALGEMVDAL